jgi:hypothetical protein
LILLKASARHRCQIKIGIFRVGANRMRHFTDGGHRGPRAGTTAHRTFVYDQSEERITSGGILSDRVIAALAAEGITSAEGLAAKSPAQLLRLPGIGKAALTEIRAFLGSRSDHRADAARAKKIAMIKSILSGYLDPTNAERAACEIAQVL